MKERKRILAGLLTSALMISCLAGCGAGTGQEDEASGKPTEITMFMWDFEGVGQDPNAPVYKTICDKFNVKIIPSATTYDQRGEKLNLLMASNTIPDIFTHAGFNAKATYEKWIKEGLVLPISDYVDDRYPNLQKVLAAFNSLADLEGGKHYGLPVINDGDPDALAEGTISNSHTLWIRKDWLNNLGLQMPQNYEDFYKVCKEFTFNDPDKNGKNDTYGLCFVGSWWTYPFLNMFNASLDRFREEDGKYIPENTSDGMKDALSYLHRMYREKILDPDFVTIKEDKVKEKFIAGSIGVLPLNAGDYYTTLYNDFKSAYPDKEPADMFDSIGVLEGPGGLKRMDGAEAFWLMTSIKADMSDTKREKILQILDWLLSDEGEILTEYGIEGEHYKVEDGKYVSLLPIGKDGKQQKIRDIDQTASIRGYVASNVKKKLRPYSPHQAEIDKSLAPSLEAAVADPTRYINRDTAELSKLGVGELYTLTTSAVIKMIISENEDITNEFNEYVEEWNRKSGKQLTEMINQQMAGK